jgi:quercetin dioxygenase-like cupin family protein
METVSISKARKFSLKEVSKHDLVTGDIRVRLLCFEAGQRDEENRPDYDVVYQVLEGEALVRVGDDTGRLGKGKLLHIGAGTAHLLENAGGGLLVVMATSRV